MCIRDRYVAIHSWLGGQQWRRSERRKQRRRRQRRRRQSGKRSSHRGHRSSASHEAEGRFTRAGCRRGLIDDRLRRAGSGGQQRASARRRLQLYDRSRSGRWWRGGPGSPGPPLGKSPTDVSLTNLADALGMSEYPPKDFQELSIGVVEVFRGAAFMSPLRGPRTRSNLDWIVSPCSQRRCSCMRNGRQRK